MSIAKALQDILAKLPQNVTLIAVSKTKPNEDILEAYQAGQRHFGENKVQEMTSKHEALPKDIAWHMIGHVQTNKIKMFAPFVYMVHGVDREKVLSELNKEASKCNRKIKALLQIHIAEEESKFGFDHREFNELIESNLPQKYPYVEICGLMGMATFTENQSQIAKEFNSLHELFLLGKSKYPAWDTLSMGMSGDWELAIQSGSTMIRVGSAIFGSRNYNH